MNHDPVLQLCRISLFSPPRHGILHVEEELDQHSKEHHEDLFSFDKNASNTPFALLVIDAGIGFIAYEWRFLSQKTLHKDMNIYLLINRMEKVHENAEERVENIIQAMQELLASHKANITEIFFGSLGKDSPTDIRQDTLSHIFHTLKTTHLAQFSKTILEEPTKETPSPAPTESIEESTIPISTQEDDPLPQKEKEEETPLDEEDFSTQWHATFEQMKKDTWPSYRKLLPIPPSQITPQDVTRLIPEYKFHYNEPLSHLLRLYLPLHYKGAAFIKWVQEQIPDPPPEEQKKEEKPSEFWKIVGNIIQVILIIVGILIFFAVQLIQGLLSQL